MITYSWSITAVDKVESGDLADVIQTVHWLAEVTDGTHVVHEFGTLELSAPDPDRFIQFNMLTKQDIVDWLEAELDVTTIRGRLNEKLKELQG